MTPEQLSERYRELQQYVDWTAADAERVRALGPLIAPALAGLIDDFYARIEQSPGACTVITGGTEQIARLKGTLLTWIRELFSGQYDEAYVARRWRVGSRHVEIGLDQIYTNVALSRVRSGLSLFLQEHWQSDPKGLWAAQRSLNKLIDLDLAIIEDAYQAAYSSAEVEEAQQRVLQAERLAAIGQMVTGLAHESRNALQRSQACLEMLTLEVQDRPEALDLVNRIQRAQDHLHQLYEEVRNYAAPIQLECEIWSLTGIWRQAWANLASAREGKQAVLHESIGTLDVHMPVDQFRLEQVFRNIFDNALAAGKPPVEIDVQCSETQLHRGPAVRVAVRDNGPGLNPEQKQRIFDPFFTTKTRGTGLGMAIARRIVEAHGGDIAVGPGNGRGAEIIITLPRGQP